MGNTFTGPAKASYQVRGFFGEGKAAVVALPTDFSLPDTLKRATDVRLAVAFAHLTGWRLIADAMAESKAKKYLLTGLDYCQTDPRLLREWNRLSAFSETYVPRLFTTKGGIFHPKALIIGNSLEGWTCAIVGSGNLSEGGFRNNIECSVYTADSAVTSELVKWFDFHFDSAGDLSKPSIDAYEKKHRQYKDALPKLRRAQEEIENKLNTQREASLAKWNEAIRMAKDYFRSAEGREWWEDCRNGVTSIKAVLNYPAFDFDAAAWKQFYAVLQLGHLNPIYRDRVYRSHGKLRTALRLLVDPQRPIESTLPAVLEEDGSLAIAGFGLNTVSKILAAHDPKKWPVFNGPVERTLKKFGYEPARGVGETGRYLAFARLMRRFMDESGAVDVLALDGFFYKYGKKKRKGSHAD